jgi:hypothetical protein
MIRLPRLARAPEIRSRRPVMYASLGALEAALGARGCASLGLSAERLALGAALALVEAPELLPAASPSTPLRGYLDAPPAWRVA